MNNFLKKLKSFLQWLENAIVGIVFVITAIVFIKIILEDIGLKISIPILDNFIEENLNFFILVLVALILKNLLLKIEPALDEVVHYISNIYFWIKEFSKFLNNKTIFIELAKYPEVWDNFINTYYVVNAPWQLEYHMKSSEIEDLINLHARRYCNEKLNQVYYIFFKDSLKNKALENFFIFIKKVREICPRADKIVKVILLINKPAPQYSLFIGEKSNLFGGEVPYCIIYIHEYPFLYKNGVPNYAIISTDKKIHTLLSTYIEKLIYEETMEEENILKFNLGQFIEYMEKNNVNSRD